MFDLFRSVLSEYIEAGAQARVTWQYTGVTYQNIETDDAAGP
jgi:hypothetical protein